MRDVICNFPFREGRKHTYGRALRPFHISHIKVTPSLVNIMTCQNSRDSNVRPSVLGKSTNFKLKHWTRPYWRTWRPQVLYFWRCWFQACCYSVFWCFWYVFGYFFKYGISGSVKFQSFSSIWCFWCFRYVFSTKKGFWALLSFFFSLQFDWVFVA